MQVSVEESGVIERKVTVTIPADDIKKAFDERIEEVMRNAKLPGFRPGKIPKNVAIKKYGKQITNEITSEKINKSYSEAMTQESIVPAGLVSIDTDPYVDGSDLKYVAVIDVFPEIDTPTLAGQSIEKPKYDVQDSDVDKTLEDIRKRNANYEAKEGASAEGDRVTIDFYGKIDGESFEGGDARDFAFVIGDGQMLEAFDSGLRGVKTGDEKEIEFTFPEDYQSSQVAGKAVVFDVKVNQVDEPSLPELDDAFAETLGITEGGLEKMREEVQKNLTREVGTRIRTMTRDVIMDKLYETIKMEIPRGLVEEEIKRATDTINEQLKQQGLPERDTDPQEYEEYARKRTALGLIIREIVQKNGMRVDPDILKTRIEEMAGGYQDSEAMVNWYYSEPDRLRQFESIILEEQVIEAMLETADVTEKDIPFEEVMKTDAAGAV